MSLFTSFQRSFGDFVEVCAASSPIRMFYFLLLQRDVSILTSKQPEQNPILSSGVFLGPKNIFCTSNSFNFRVTPRLKLPINPTWLFLVPVGGETAGAACNASIAGEKKKKMIETDN